MRDEMIVFMYEYEDSGMSVMQRTRKRVMEKEEAICET